LVTRPHANTKSPDHFNATCNSSSKLQ